MVTETSNIIAILIFNSLVALNFLHSQIGANDMLKPIPYKHKRDGILCTNRRNYFKKSLIFVFPKLVSYWFWKLLKQETPYRKSQNQ